MARTTTTFTISLPPEEEIGNTEGIKEEFVTGILIEAKENEILRSEMGE